MTTATTASDVFAMAIGMERVGKDFYESLAVTGNDAKVCEFCMRAAREEADHLAVFQQMRQQWAKSANAGPTGAQYPAALETWAKAGIQPNPAAAQKVALAGNVKDALNMAIQMEKDAILFYGGLAVNLPGLAQVIQGIVEQEQKHLTALQWLVR